MTANKLLQALTALLLITALTSALSGEPMSIMTWGVRPSELALPYVTEIRHGCHADPLVCVERYKSNGQINYVAIAFAQPELPELNIGKARAYSLLSERIPELKEIGLDDFFAFMRKLKATAKDNYLEQLIDATKSANSSLRFGVTVYEDEISKIKRDQSTFSPSALAKIDRVALYVHYRTNGSNYPEYVRAVKGLFPNAKIYGGVYHYDRADYIRCSQDLPGKCSKERELGTYRDLLQMQFSMLFEGQLNGLEFYPGFFGNESAWSGWSKERSCSVDRRSECVANSQAMTRETLQLFRR
ncbi:hypothetical protein QTI66_01170 [Variovorax sp. J22R133]|uniref:hypothetical protein n=1 Tax=Variovorax brevis TaxID=3053503 RepID=UPI002577F349|nr:hypothetical protein [Variovorax sp. J22R133]MDM0110736.1 hypothetical protein [Variovorax sp. J22R133]